jgi:hypothetical protein
VNGNTETLNLRMGFISPILLEEEEEEILENSHQDETVRKQYGSYENKSR